METKPVDRAGLAAALKLFVTTFVVADKRTQVHTRLLATERRLETLETLPRWIATRTTPLAGADQSPAGIRARFGEVVGVYLAEAGASRVTIADALVLGRGTTSLFVADNGNISMISSSSGAPILCSRF